MKPQLYDQDNPIKWRDLGFEDLLKLIEGRLNFHVNRHYRGNYLSAPPEGNTSIPGLLVEDLRQELSYVVWFKVVKQQSVPPEIINFDYRFLKYVDTLLRRAIIDLYRTKTYADKNDLEPHPKNHGQVRPKRKYRDLLSFALPLPEDADQIIPQ